MLEFFRNYQKYFFFLVTFVVVFSFLFFGAYSAIDVGEKKIDRILGKTVLGSKIMESEVEKLSRFIASDQHDSFSTRGALPNLCNDGVIRNDFLQEGLADLLVSSYFPALSKDLSLRLDRIKRYRFYCHPQAEFLSSKTIWDHFVPGFSEKIAQLQEEKEVSLDLFLKLKELYSLKNALHPDMLKTILLHQQKELSCFDPRIEHEDLSLFGFHSASDWFGKNFVTLVSEFILNVADVAYEKGYRVSLSEAKGDLIHHFQESTEKMKGFPKVSPVHFEKHLLSLGFDETSAAELWSKVLLFRKYFKMIGEAVFVDRIPWRKLADFSFESASIQVYRPRIEIKDAKDLAAFQIYLNAISEDTVFPPSSFRSIASIEKKMPELVQAIYKAKVAEVSKGKLASKVSVSELWSWQTEDANWKVLKSKFPLESLSSKEERFALLNRLSASERREVDAFSRFQIVENHPDWIEEALDEAPFEEKEWTVFGEESPIYHKKDVYTRIKEMELVEDKKILSFNEAKRSLLKRVKAEKENFSPQENPFFSAAEKALKDLKRDPEAAIWVQSEDEPLLDQFKFEKKQTLVCKNSKEEWMKSKAFKMLPDTWSPVRLAEDGEVVFFYLEEKVRPKASLSPIILAEKQVLSKDAKLYFAGKFLEEVQRKNAIIIPVEKEDE